MTKQEFAARALAHLSSLKKDEAFNAWLTRILINACYDILRRSQREVYPDTIPETTATQQEDIGLFELFHRLDERYRLPMVLHYVEGWDLLKRHGCCTGPWGRSRASSCAGGGSSGT